MSTYLQSVGPESAWELGVPGELFRLVQLSSKVRLTFKKNGVPISAVKDVMDGFWSRPAGGFSSVLIESDEVQDVTVGVFSGDAGYDRYSGTVNIGSPVVIGEPVEIAGEVAISASAMTPVHTPKTISWYPVTILDANEFRKYLLIQNKGGRAIYLVFGADASLAEGVMLNPGGVWEFAGVVPIVSLSAMTAGGVNDQVVVVEG